MFTANTSVSYRSVLILVLTGLMSLAGVSGYTASETATAISAKPSGPSHTAQDVSPASHCQYCIAPADKSFISAGGNGSVAVTAPAGCNWTASTEDGFITLTSGSSGNGNGMVTYTVAPHSGPSRRVGHLTIAGQTHRVLQGIAFNDVPPEYLFYNEIGKLSGRGITLGCSQNPPRYCPEQPVTREQMAAFIIRALGDFTPPAPPAQRFQDVPPSNIFYAFIEQLAVRQITVGCAANPPLYCPTQPVTREQMAAFLIRALHEPGYVPPPPQQQRFQDVPPTNPFYAHIEELAARGITLGCSQNPPLYCPTQVVTRGQMAAFLIRAFDAGINRPPSVAAGPDRAVTLPSVATLNGFASDDGRPSCALTFLWSQVSGPGTVTFSDPDGEATLATFSAPGVYVLRLMASDFQDASSDDVTVLVNALNPGNQPPSANAGADQTLTLPATVSLNGMVSDDGVPAGGALTAAWSRVSGPGTVIFSAASAATTTASFSAAGSYVLRLIASDSVLTAGDEVTITVNADPTPPPPDPATVAPPINPTATTTLGAATQFLYTGPNPIQTGVAAGTILPVRAAVLRGRVRNTGGAPLPLVKITVLNHPEFGQTLTRADGMFDMAVNGGGLLTVRYEKAGFLEVQRQERVAWQDYCPLPDVVLTGHDSRVTHIDLSANIPIQVAQANPVSDGDGTRRATLLFRQGTTATMVLPGGATQPLTNLHVRATEYTVGPNGPQAMPGELPATSAYTYAVEFNADEAVAAGGRSVLFSQPVINYMENFLDFPVGGIAPVGSYDRAASCWVPENNGRVLRVLSVTGGVANLDVTGSGQPASDADYAALGITVAERQQLAGLYSAGHSLWRVPIMHFTPWDVNWPYGPPPDAVASNQPPPTRGGPEDDPCEQTGSIIECQNQILGESLGITGAAFSLNYRSNRAPGHAADRTLDISLSGPSVPPSLRRIELEVLVAGQRFTQSLPAAPNQRATFTWDGRDVYGRTVQGNQSLTIRIGYVYPLTYLGPDNFIRSFGRFGSGVSFTLEGRDELAIWQQFREIAGNWDARAQGLGGWTLSAHHAYDPMAQTLYLGDGSRRSVAGLPLTINTVAGGGPNCGATQPCGDGGPATGASIIPHGLAVDGQGNLYIADPGHNRVRKVDPLGIITTVAGTGDSGFSGDGGPATAARLQNPQSVAVDAQGNLLIADSSNHRIRKVDASGIITTVAGNGTVGDGGDDGPATQAQLGFPEDIAAAPDGSFYIADANVTRVRRVSADGIITTVVNSASIGCGGCTTSAIEVDEQGNVLFAQRFAGSGGAVRRLSPDGRVTTIAGGGFNQADGIPATEANLQVLHLAVDRSGSIFINDFITGRVRVVNSVGIITSVTRGVPPLPVPPPSGDGGQAALAFLRAFGVAVDEQGNLLISDHHSPNSSHRVRKVNSPLPVFSGPIAIASEDGSQLYNFNFAGRHLSTVNALTGAIVYTFAYDSNGRLTSVTDADSNVTAIERNLSGQPTAIVAPFGQRTTLTLDGNGYLASVTNPAGEAYQCAYTGGGLLTTFRDPNGNASTMTYDGQGRLTRDEHAASGFFALARMESAASFTVSLTSALNRATGYQVERLASGEERRVNTFPNGLQTQETIGTSDRSAVTYPDGTMTTLLPGPDPRWGMQSPLSASQTVTTPGGLTYTATRTRAVTLTNPNDPLSLATQTDTASVNGRAYTSVYTAASRTFNSASPTGRQHSITIDAQGRVTQAQVAALNPASYAYDARGRLAGVTSGNGAEARALGFTYNTNGYLETITDPLGRPISFMYNAAGRITRQTFPDGRMSGYAYDANGNVTAITPPGRPAHSFTYTPVNLVETYTPPNVAGGGTNQTLYTYNADRQVTRITRPDSLALNFAYDSGGRLSAITLPGGQYSYAYHATTGNLASVTTPDGISLSYSYDGSLLTGVSWTGAVSGSVTRAYDNNLRVASQSVNGGNPISFQYDNDSLLTGAGSLTITRSAQNGLITGTTLGNAADARGYNGFADLTNYAATYNGAGIYTAQYTYDQLGRVAQKIETIGGVTDTYIYTYDLVGRLTGVQKNGVAIATYTYDSNNNRLSYTGPGPAVNGSYDNQDRLTQYGATTYTYTANGELLSKTQGSQTTAYQYDVLGNLKAVTLPGGTQIEYLTDGKNRRMGKRVNGALTQGFLYQDRLKPIAELDGNNNVVSRFVYATRENVPDYMIKGGQTYRIIMDQLGSPRLVVNVTTGEIVQRIDYDEFGVVLLDTNPGFQPFGFAGGLYDPQTRLVRFGARDYDAETGRWTAKDPILFAGVDTNLYGYALNDPVNLKDATGLYANSALLAAGSGTGAGLGGSALVAGAAVAGAGLVGLAIGTGINYFAGDAIQDGLDWIFGDPTRPQRDPRPPVFPERPDDDTRPGTPSDDPRNPDPLTDPDITQPFPRIDPSELPTDPNMPSPWDPDPSEEPTKRIKLPPQPKKCPKLPKTKTSSPTPSR